MFKQKTKKWHLIALVVLGLLLNGCGDDENNETSSDPSNPPTVGTTNVSGFPTVGGNANNAFELAKSAYPCSGQTQGRYDIEFTTPNTAATNNFGGFNNFYSGPAMVPGRGYIGANQGIGDVIMVTPDQNGQLYVRLSMCTWIANVYNYQNTINYQYFFGGNNSVPQQNSNFNNGVNGNSQVELIGPNAGLSNFQIPYLYTYERNGVCSFGNLRASLYFYAPNVAQIGQNPTLVTEFAEIRSDICQ